MPLQNSPEGFRAIQSLAILRSRMKLHKQLILTLTFIILQSGASFADEFRLLSGDANNEPRGESIRLYDVSDDGTLVLFSANTPTSGSAPGITEGGLYRRNLATDTLTFVGDNSITPLGVLEASMSDDGRYIAWSTSPDPSGNNHIYWRDTQTGTSVDVTPTTDNKSRRPVISGDGRYVAFASLARNLIADVTKLPAIGRLGVYRYDSQSSTIDIISLTSQGTALATGISASGTVSAAMSDFDLSGDGNFLAFTSDANNVTPDSTGGVWAYRRNLTNGTIDLVNRTEGGAIANATYTKPSLSRNGNRISFIGALLGLFGTKIIDRIPASFGNEALAKDLTTGKLWWVSDTLNDTALSAEFGATVIHLNTSGDGTVVAMTAVSTNLVPDDVFPDAGTRDSFDIYRVQLQGDGNVSFSHVNRPHDGASVNISLRSDGLMPGNAAYVAYGTSDVEVALDVIKPTTLGEQQAVGVGDFSAIGGPTTTTSSTTSTVPSTTSSTAPTSSTSSTSSTSMPTTTLPVTICGDADGNGKVQANDALTTLRTAVGLAVCPLSLCDVDGDGRILAGDALTTLRFAVGLLGVLNCL